MSSELLVTWTQHQVAPRKVQAEQKFGETETEVT